MQGREKGEGVGRGFEQLWVARQHEEEDGPGLATQGQRGGGRKDFSEELL